MGLFTKIIGWVFFPIKLLFALLDPVLRFVEMAINIPLAFILGNIVDLINMIPSIGFIHIGELVLGILTGVGFGLLNAFVFHLPIHIVFVILICIGATIIGYFVSYLLFKFIIGFITSIVSLVIVVVRVAIYLPGSIWLTVIKALVPTGIWCFIFFFNLQFWTSDPKMITFAILFLIALLILCSVIVLFIRRDVKFNSLGVLGEVPLEELSSFTHSIGLYIMTLGTIPVYIGRAIEFNNGGLRKRIRDYQRGVNTHSSGTFIQQHLDELYLYILELGHTGEDVEFVEEAETSMISSIFTKLNDKDAVVSYILNILGYIIGAVLASVLACVFLGFTIPAFCIIGYSIIVAIVCVVFYCIESSQKRFAGGWSA